MTVGIAGGQAAPLAEPLLTQAPLTEMRKGIRAQEAKLQEMAAQPTQSVSATYPILQLGSQGPSVLKLQQWLSRLGHYSGPMDGQYGPATAEAVEDFQSLHQQSSSGVVKQETWQALRRALNPQAQLRQLSLLMLKSPTFSELTPNAPPPPPSPIWLLVMPMVPLVGGAWTYTVRRLKSKDPFAHSEQESTSHKVP
ncbi:MAG TPA: peptidoglycan-binding domain-containing protein [Leptolyngbyaceae cyanobacterium]